MWGGGPSSGPAVSSATVNAPFVDRKSTRLNSSHSQISYAVFCLKKKNLKRGQCEAADFTEVHSYISASMGSSRVGVSEGERTEKISVCVGTINSTNSRRRCSCL